MNRLWQAYGLPLVLAGAIWLLSVHDLLWLALIIVVAVEWPNYRSRPTRALLLTAIPFLSVGVSAAVLIALYPRALSQIAIAGTYAIYRLWIADEHRRHQYRWPIVMIGQVALFEALFLAAAIWHPEKIYILVAIWVSSFSLVYAILSSYQERAAAVLAAAWALVAAEAAWVFLSWLVSYVIAGGYVVVPQPTIVLSGLAYCAGSIYLAGRQKQLSRARLTEYLIITLILIILVVAGTGWRGTI
jgi:hypothetical protein